MVIFNLAKGGFGVQYQHPGCPPRTVRGFFRVVRVSADGNGCTSDDAPKGWRYFRAEYTTADGSRVNSPFQWIATDPSRNLEIGFVGTEEEMQKNWDKYPR